MIYLKLYGLFTSRYEVLSCGKYALILLSYIRPSVKCLCLPVPGLRSTILGRKRIYPHARRGSVAHENPNYIAGLEVTLLHMLGKNPTYSTLRVCTLSTAGCNSSRFRLNENCIAFTLWLRLKPYHCDEPKPIDFNLDVRAGEPSHVTCHGLSEQDDEDVLLSHAGSIKQASTSSDSTCGVRVGTGSSLNPLPTVLVPGRYPLNQLNFVTGCPFLARIRHDPRLGSNREVTTKRTNLLIWP